MMTSDLDYRAIRKRVEAGIAEQKMRSRTVLFAVSIFIYALFMIIGWGMFLSSGGQNVPIVDAQGDNILVGAMVLISMGGGMGLLFQFISLMMESKRSEERIRDRLMAREINREMMRMGVDDVEDHEKRKGMMRLTDDGELEAIDDVAEVEVPIQQNRKQ